MMMAIRRPQSATASPLVPALLAASRTKIVTWPAPRHWRQPPSGAPSRRGAPLTGRIRAPDQPTLPGSKAQIPQPSRPPR
jgi:hypothetical protein